MPDRLSRSYALFMSLLQLAGLAQHANEFSKLAEAEQFLFEVIT